MTIPSTLLTNIIQALDSKDALSLDWAINNLNKEITKLKETIDIHEARTLKAKQLLDLSQGLAASLLIRRVKSLKINVQIENEYDRCLINNNRLLDILLVLNKQLLKYKEDVDSLDSAYQALVAFCKLINKNDNT